MNSLKIVVTGLIGSIPLAGLTMHYLQYVLGLHELGHDVLYLEDTGTWYYDLKSDSMVEDNFVPLSYLQNTMSRHGLDNRWTFIDHRGEQFGCVGNDFREFLRSADLFINVTGAGIMRDDYLQISRRAYIDTDPGFIQLRIERGNEKDVEQLNCHNSHFTFGMNMGEPGCLIPAAGFRWFRTVQPICLQLLPVAPVPSVTAPFTTILKWQSYSAIEHGDEVYGLKDMEFKKFLNLPEGTIQELEIAYTGRPPVENLEAYGWRFRKGHDISSSVDNYLRYIQESRGEWSIAKNAYVKMRSGWFSERSACYLASGRPVVVQDTGFTDWLHADMGVKSFRTPDEALAAIDDVNSRYEAHCRAAREVAEAYFDARKVLPRLIEGALNPTCATPASSAETPSAGYTEGA